MINSMLVRKTYRVFETTSDVGYVIEIPYCLSWTENIRITHFWHLTTTHDFICCWLFDHITTGNINDQHGHAGERSLTSQGPLETALDGDFRFISPMKIFFDGKIETICGWTVLQAKLIIITD